MNLPNNMKISILFIALFFSSLTVQADNLLLKTGRISGNVPIKSWKSLRDARVVKQDLDYSCGAASIATVLTEYYQRKTSEREVLELLIQLTGKQGRASFAGMASILPKLGFRAVGLATTWDKLVELKIPVIIYVRQRKEDHFTVISGIDKQRVRLSDSSLGNRVLTRGQFKEIWETREEEGLEGKMLAILPADQSIGIKRDGSFFIQPLFSEVPETLLTLR